MKVLCNKLRRKSLIFIIIFGVFIFHSCTTYFIPKESFVKQFEGIDSTNLKHVTVIGPVGTFSKYQANPITVIKCLDPKGNEIELNNGPSIEIRFTINNKKKMIFYFDRLIVREGIVYGVQSRFLGIKNYIPLKDITKIEIQNGSKNFRYLITESNL